MVLTVARQDAGGVDLLLIGAGQLSDHGTVQPIWTCHGGAQTEQQQEESRLHLGSQLSGARSSLVAGVFSGEWRNLLVQGAIYRVFTRRLDT